MDSLADVIRTILVISGVMTVIRENGDHGIRAAYLA
jgi:hypothetical protein